MSNLLRKQLGIVEAIAAKPVKPLLTQLLYDGPNKTRDRRKCENCPIWIGPENRCVVHGPDVETVADHVCGYHVFGSPMEDFEWSDTDDVKFVEPKYSGLVRVPGGTGCDNCRYYVGDTKSGRCTFASDGNGNQAPVDARGCCAAWRP